MKQTPKSGRPIIEATAARWRAKYPQAQIVCEEHEMLGARGMLLGVRCRGRELSTFFKDGTPSTLIEPAARYTEEELCRFLGLPRPS